jgi:hypothetical protein
LEVNTGKKAKVDKPYKNKAWLYDQIRNKVKTSRQIADELGVHLNTIVYWRKIHKIPSHFSIEENPASEELSLPKYEEIQKEIKQAGGTGIWAQKEAIELFCFSKHLLDQVNKLLIQLKKEGNTAQWITGLFKAITQLSKCASQLKELMPARSNIEFIDSTHKVSQEDREAVNKLNELLSTVKEDADFGDEKPNAWYSPGEEVPIKMPHANNRN